jgi:hypothetical protein
MRRSLSSNITRAKKDWRFGSGGRVPALQVQSPRVHIPVPSIEIRPLNKNLNYFDAHIHGNTFPDLFFIP